MNKKKVLFGILLLAFVLRLIFVFQTPVRIWDETVYANLGSQLSHDLKDYSLLHSEWGDFIPAGEYPYSWPNIGFRAPLLPYTLSIFYFLHIDFLILFFIPLIGTASVFLIYLLGEKIFNEKVGLYCAFFLSIIPLHVINSGLIMTDVYAIFWLLLGLISFWAAYEEDRPKYSILCGIFLGLAVLSRYTMLWVLPLFPIYLLIKRKIRRNAEEIFATLIMFFLVLTPIFIYGYNSYGNIFGAFIHGFYASTYWGGVQDWLFYFENWVVMFSVIGLWIIPGAYFLSKKINSKPYLFTGLFFVLILLMGLFTKHKEERFILPLVIPICLISALFLFNIKYKKAIIIITSIFVAITLGVSFTELTKNYYDGTNHCFSEAVNYFEKVEGEYRIINDESAVLYYYLKEPITFTPSLDPQEIRKYMQNNTYLMYTDANMPLFIEENEKALEEWDKEFEIVFECDKDWGLSRIYK